MVLIEKQLGGRIITRTAQYFKISLLQFLDIFPSQIEQSICFNCCSREKKLPGFASLKIDLQP